MFYFSGILVFAVCQMHFVGGILHVIVSFKVVNSFVLQFCCRLKHKRHLENNSLLALRPNLSASELLLCFGVMVLEMGGMFVFLIFNFLTVNISWYFTSDYRYTVSTGASFFLCNRNSYLL